MLNRDKIKSILVISLSNIGDIVMTFPVIDILKQDFPASDLSVVAGPKGEGLFKDNPNITALHIFDKRMNLSATLRWLSSLRKNRYDLIVDLRNTAIPFFLRTRHRTSFFLKRTSGEHMCAQHLNRLKSVHPFSCLPPARYCLHIPLTVRERVQRLLQSKIGTGRKFIVIAPGAADRGKRWPAENFAGLSDSILGRGDPPVVYIGDKNDHLIVRDILGSSRKPAADLSGQLSLLELAALLEAGSLLICNDTAPMHMASYLDRPVLALFGPTDPVKYGPWSSLSCIIEHKVSCPACRQRTKKLRHSCLEAVTVENVLAAFTFTPEGVEFKSQL